MAYDAAFLANKIVPRALPISARGPSSKARLCPKHARSDGDLPYLSPVCFAYSTSAK